MSDTPQLTVAPVQGLGEIRPGDDLAELLTTHTDLADGDIVVVTSKVVSKAEGRVVAGDRLAAIAGETDRVVARRGPTSIVRTRHGLVMAAAGVDASNTPAGTVVLLPADPDASARALRERLGANVAVVVSDTAGRAWRTGQTDIAVGAAGLEVLDDHAGRTDRHGNLLAVTAPAVADELAAATDLVKGKLSDCPAAVVRGLGHLVLPPGRHGPGAAALVRPEGQDMFGLGSREAVVVAVTGDREGRRGFGDPSPADDLSVALARLLDGLPAPGEVRPGDGLEVVVEGLSAREAGATEARLTTLAHCHGWRVVERHADRDTDVRVRLRPGTP